MTLYCSCYLIDIFNDNLEPVGLRMVCYFIKGTTNYLLTLIYEFYSATHFRTFSVHLQH
jgi:hypothetical protein